MTDDIFTYRIEFDDFPKQKEAVLKCFGGYTVYIDSRLDNIQAIKEYRHALRHIIDGDLDNFDGNVQEIEEKTHK